MIDRMFDLPERTDKPRVDGITMVIDSGIPYGMLPYHLEQVAEYIDYVKLGWGTAAITKNLKKKIEEYDRFNIPVCLGGTFFELAYLQNKISDMVLVAKEYGVSMIEISDGSITIDHNEKIDNIEKMSEEFVVLSEFGSKDSDILIAPHIWVSSMQKELDAGAWKVIAEGRESGTSGLYRKNKELRSGLVVEIIDFIPEDKIIWETPLRSQQAWFVEQLGSNVNLGNIAISDVISLETIRLGLRADTINSTHDNKKIT